MYYIESWFTQGNYLEKQVVTKYRYYLNNIKVGESTEIELIGENIGYASDFEIKD